MKLYNPFDVLNFGKNKGHLLKDVYKYQPSYIEWLILNVEDFAINLEAFVALPKPTPLMYGFVLGTKEYRIIMEDKNISLFNQYTKIDHNQLISINDIFQFIASGHKLKEIDYEFPEDVVILNKQKLEKYNLTS
jgi:hypothetical protein